MSNLRIEKKVFDTLIPHSGSMSFLSGIVDWSENFDWLVSRARVGEDFLFYNNVFGGIPSYVGFEHMAQSISALSGLERYLDGKTEKRIGFIMGVRNYTAACRTLPLNEDFDIRVEELHRDGSVVSFRGNLEFESETIAEGIINAFEPERGESI